MKLALEYADILRYEHDPRAHDIAVTLAFEKKHGSGFRSVRSELLGMEKTWRSGPGHGYSYDLSFAIMQWSKIVDLERARKAEEMAERRIEREILGWDRDAVQRWRLSRIGNPRRLHPSLFMCISPAPYFSWSG